MSNRSLVRNQNIDDTTFQPESKGEGHAGNGWKTGKEAAGAPESAASFRVQEQTNNPKEKALFMMKLETEPATNIADNQHDKNWATFGSAVRARRKELGISQEALAGRAGLHRTYVCDVERGARNVSLDSIIRLSSGLETQPSALFQGTYIAERVSN